MDYKVISACGLQILAKEAFGTIKNTPKHDLVMLKNDKQRKYWEQKVQGRKARMNNILELGIARGGSLPYMLDICDADFIVGVDIATEDPKISRIYDRSEMKGKYALHFETNQTDREALQSIVAQHFPDGLDLIVDDASHLLSDTRISFEILFPYLKTGGLYVIEDYSWSHNESFGMLAADRYRQQPTTTQLVIELTMLMSTHHDWITRVIADYNTITVVKGPEKVPNPFSIKDYTVNWAHFELEKMQAP